MYPRNMVCFRYIIVNILHKGDKGIIIIIIIIIIIKLWASAVTDRDTLLSMF
jgi:hypothetical protein